jgi:hypothetical protein
MKGLGVSVLGLCMAGYVKNANISKKLKVSSHAFNRILNLLLIHNKLQKIVKIPKEKDKRKHIYINFSKRLGTREFK